MSDQERMEHLENNLSLVVKRQLKLESNVTALYQYFKVQKDCLSETIDVLEEMIKSLTK